MSKATQHGFTLNELLLFVALVGMCVALGAWVYVIFHFVAKFW